MSSKGKYITYGKGGIVEYNKSLQLAKLKARIRKDFIDIRKEGEIRSIYDFRKGGFGDSKGRVVRKMKSKRKKR